MRMRLVAALGVAGTLAWSQLALADDAKSAAAAKRLFEEGRKALADGRVGAACEAFAEAKRLAPEACGVIQNLAMCRQQQGRYLDASAEFDALATCATKAGQPDRVKFADDQRAALAPKLALLTVVAGSGPKVVTLYVDGAKVDGSDGKAHAVEPGRHRVEVEREGCATERLEATLVAGQSQVLTLTTCGTAATTQTTATPAAPAAAAPPAAPPPMAPPAEPAPGVRWQIPVGWSAVALGSVGLASSVLPCGLIALREDDNDKQKKTATVCTTLAIAGGVVLGLGVLVLLTAPHAPPPKARAWGIAPRIAGTRDLGVDAVFRF